MTTVISVEHLSKSYKLGQINTGTFRNDAQVWWAKVRGKPNPLLRIGETDHANRAGEEIWALRDVSFTVEQGEVLGIIGRNGAGKSTLLKILSRVTAPTEGRVRVKGRIASLLEVGTGFHPELTGRENIYLNGAILGMTKQEVARKFDEIVAFAEVEQFIDTPVKRYSSGMYVRLAFAVAAHLDPEILIVDEVLAVGDVEFQRKCLGKMGQVAGEGRTVLFVSHNMAAIQNLCSKTMILEKGNSSGLMDTASAIRRYIGVEKLDDLRGTWHHPEDSEGELLVKQIDLLQGDVNTDHVRMSKSFKIKFSLSESALRRDCALALQILDHNNDVIIHSMDIFHDNPEKDFQSKGNRLAIIPAYGLAAGDYWLSYSLGNFNEGVWDLSANVLHWRVQADSAMMMRISEREWKGKVGPGLVHWEILSHE